MGFKKNPNDLCSYTRTLSGNTCNILVSVDDLLITSTAATDLQEVATTLKAKYGGVATNEGLTHDYLGIHWDFSEPGQVSLAMNGYVQDVLTKFPPTPGATTPALNSLFTVSPGSTPLSKTAREQYHSAVMTLHYLAKRVRPDILILRDQSPSTNSRSSAEARQDPRISERHRNAEVDPAHWGERHVESRRRLLFWHL